MKVVLCDLSFCLSRATERCGKDGQPSLPRCGIIVCPLMGLLFSVLWPLPSGNWPLLVSFELMMHTKDKYHGAHCVIAAFDGYSGDIQLKYSKFCLFFNRHHCYCTSYFTTTNTNLMCNVSGNGIPSPCFHAHFSVLHHKRLTETKNVIYQKFSCSLETFVDLWEKQWFGRWKHICQISCNVANVERTWRRLSRFPIT